MLGASFGTTLAFWALSGFQASSQGAVGKIVISGKEGMVLVLMIVLVLVRACGLDVRRGGSREGILSCKPWRGGKMALIWEEPCRSQSQVGYFSH